MRTSGSHGKIQVCDTVVHWDERLVQVKSQSSRNCRSYSEARSKPGSCRITNRVKMESFSGTLEGFLDYTARDFVMMLCCFSRMDSYPSRRPIRRIHVSDYRTLIIDHACPEGVSSRFYS